ncbi:MAG: MFS transporter [Ardenticatenaceae bacterium]|nr:MFS transporter [Ardenticatenaceae bacterium]
MQASQAKTSLSLMAIFFVIPGALIVNPAIQTIADAYPTIPHTLILLLSTIPLLIVVPMSLISGALAGNKVKYKHLLFVAMVFYVIGGSLPFVFRAFYAVLGARVIYGIGVGILTPLANGIIIQLYAGQKRANMMGMGSIVINVASTIFMLLSGLISAIDLNFMWLIHLIGIIPLVIMMLYLPEPEKVEPQQHAKVKMPVSVYFISLATIFIYMNLNTMLLNMSTILTTENIGNAATAGTVLSMYTVGGILGGTLFGKYFQFFGKMTNPSALVVMGIGLGIISFAVTVPMMIVGCAVAGIGFFILFPALLMDAGQRVSLTASAMVSAMIFSSINFGGFLASVYIGFLSQLFSSTSPRLSIAVSMAVMFIAAAIWGLITVFSNSYSDIAVEAQ